MATYTGTSGADVFVGTAANDGFTFTHTPTGGDSVDGGGGIDTLSLSFGGTADSFSGYFALGADLSWQGSLSNSVDSTSYANIERLAVQLGSGNDYLAFAATPLSDPSRLAVLRGGAGQDTLTIGFTGLENVTFIHHANGSVTSSHGTYAQWEQYVVLLEGGANVVTTGAGGDVVYASGGSDTIVLGDGDDAVRTADGTVGTVDGGEGYDRWQSYEAEALTGSAHAFSGGGGSAGGVTATNIEQIEVVGGLGDDAYEVGAPAGTLGIYDAGGEDTLTVDLSGAGSDPGWYSLTGTNDGFSGHLEGNASTIDFFSVEHVSIVLGDGDDYGNVTPTPIHFGATLALDGGLGTNSLDANFSGFENVSFIVGTDGSITSSVGSFARFQRFDIAIGAGTNTVTTGDMGDTIHDFGGNQTIHAGGGDDVITTTGSAATVTTVDGGDGYDHWISSRGMDEPGTTFVLSAAGSSDGSVTAINVESVQALGGTGDDLYIVDGTLAYASLYDNGGYDRAEIDFSGTGAGESFGHYIYADGSSGAYSEFYGSLVNTAGRTDFWRIDDLDIVFGDGDDTVVFYVGSVAQGAAGSLDGGLGGNRLGILFGGLSDVSFIVAADGSITASHGSYARFQSFDLQIQPDVSSAVVTTRDGNDIINSQAQVSVIDAGAGDDQITTMGGADTVDGGEGYDSWAISASADTVGRAYVLSAAASTAGVTSGVNIESVAVYSGSGDDTFTIDHTVDYSSIQDFGGRDSLTLDWSGFGATGQYLMIGASDPGAFHAYRASGGNLASYWGIEVLDITLTDGDDVVGLDAAPLAGGAAISIDAGLGADWLSIDGRAVGGLDFALAADGTITSNLGGFAGFESFNFLLGAGMNRVTTGGGADVFALYEGDSTVDGGAGDDTFSVYAGTADLDGGEGYDGLYLNLSGAAAPLALSIAAEVSGGGITARGMESVGVTGSALDDSFTVASGFGPLWIDGWEGTDSLVATLTAIGAGNLVIHNGGSGFQVNFYDGAGVSSVFYGIENVDLTLGDGDDTSISVDASFSLLGGSLRIDGGGGEDTITLAGFSTGYSLAEDGAGGYVVTDIDAADGDYGSFRVNRIEHLAFQDRVVDLAAPGGGGVFVGTAGDDSLVGTDYDDTLQGGGGDDLLDGRGGTDTARYSDAPGGVRVDLALVGPQNTRTAGFDTLIGIENLVGSGDADLLYGNDGANVLDGGAGGDLLDGRGGADTLRGGTGNDVYVVDDAGDTVVEQPGEGADTVRTALGAYTLGANLEGLVYAGTGDFTGTGNDLDNRLIGATGADTLYGLEGNDALNGGAGADLLVGGTGNDAYIVDDAGDQVVELDGEGIDAVRTTLSSYTLGAHVEGLVYSGTGDFTGTGNTLANVLRGADGADTLYGLDGNDALDGGTGADLLVGGTGNDAYIVDDAGDQVVELDGEGTDAVRTTLSSYTLGAHVEGLSYAGTDDFTGTGNDFVNALLGGTGADRLVGLGGGDVLRGQDGADVLVGGAGRDILQGGAGADTFVFDLLETSANGDLIGDFLSGEDRIEISLPAFAGLAGYGLGALDTADLFFGAQATNTEQHLVYNSANGALYYDADGLGGAAAIRIASLGIGTALVAADIYLV